MDACQLLKSISVLLLTTAKFNRVWMDLEKLLAGKDSANTYVTKSFTVWDSTIKKLSPSCVAAMYTVDATPISQGMQGRGWNTPRNSPMNTPRI